MVTTSAHIRFASWIKDMSRRLLAALMIGLVTVVLLATTTFVLWLAFSAPPFDVTLLSQPPSEALCPGDAYDAWVEISTRGTVVIFIYVTNKMPDGNHVVHPKQGTTVVIPVGGKTVFRQSIRWYVPDVPPGISNRVLGFRGHDSDEKPLVFGDGQPSENGQVFMVATREECLARERKQ